MSKLTAVRVEDRGGIRKVSGYVSRGKNRKRVWVVEGTDLSGKELKALVAKMEETRTGKTEA